MCRLEFVAIAILLLAPSTRLSAQVETPATVVGESPNPIRSVPILETSKPKPIIRVVEGRFDPIPNSAKSNYSATSQVKVSELPTEVKAISRLADSTFIQSAVSMQISNKVLSPTNSSIAIKPIYSIGGVEVSGFNPNDVGYMGPGDMRTHLWNDHSADLLRNGIDQAGLNSMPMERVQKWHNFFHGTEGLPGAGATGGNSIAQPMGASAAMKSTFPAQQSRPSLSYGSEMFSGLGTIIQAPVVQPTQQSTTNVKPMAVDQPIIVSQPFGR